MLTGSQKGRAGSAALQPCRLATAARLHGLENHKWGGHKPFMSCLRICFMYFHFAEKSRRSNAMVDATLRHSSFHVVPLGQPILPTAPPNGQV